MGHLCWFITVLYLGVWIASPVFGEDQKVAPVIDPQVQQIMMEAGTFLKSVDRFTFRVESTREVVLEDGQKLQYEGTSDVAVRRPNGLYAKGRGDLLNAQLWYDGNLLTALNIDENAYASAKVPSTIDAAFDYAAEHFGISPPLIEIAYSSPAATFLERVQTGIYVGLHGVRGVTCHHMAFTQEHLDWQIWIEQGFTPAIRKVVITYKKEPSFPQYVAVLSNWDFSPSFPDSLFTFLKPEDAVFRPFDTVRPEGLPEREQ